MGGAVSNFLVKSPSTFTVAADRVGGRSILMSAASDCASAARAFEVCLVPEIVSRYGSAVITGLACKRDLFTKNGIGFSSTFWLA